MKEYDRTDVDGVAAEVTAQALQYVDVWTGGGSEPADEFMNAAAISRATSAILAAAFQEISKLREELEMLREVVPEEEDPDGKPTDTER